MIPPVEDGLGGRGGLSINLATLRGLDDPARALEACAAAGVRAVAPWRDQVDALGLERAASLLRGHDMRVTGLCRGGMFTADTPERRRAAIDDNRQAIDEAAAIRAECLVLVVGGLPEGSRDLPGARQMVTDGIAAVHDHARDAGVPLAIEPLHPMYAADRSCVNTLGQALDVCDAVGGDTGVAVDAYHVWWDPDLAAQVARAGARIHAHHICDWLVPTRDLLLDRGMMGDGVVDLTAFRDLIEGAGFRGPQEVEIFSRDDWWTRDADEVVRTCVERYRAI